LFRLIGDIEDWSVNGLGSRAVSSSGILGSSDAPYSMLLIVEEQIQNTIPANIPESVVKDIVRASCVPGSYIRCFMSKTKGHNNVLLISMS
jgi:hypothetical protein